MSPRYFLKNSRITEKTAEEIYTVLDHLPTEVKDFVLKDVCFTEFRKDNKDTVVAFCIHVDYRLLYEIIFDSRFYKSSREMKRYVIAHEIGHAYLKHYYRDLDKEQEEKEADDFAAKYGFKKVKFNILNLREWNLQVFVIVLLIIFFGTLPAYVEYFEKWFGWMVFWGE